MNEMQQVSQSDTEGNPSSGTLMLKTCIGKAADN